MNKTASPELYQELERMSWPGNVRELENVMERLVITNGNETILPEHPVSPGDRERPSNYHEARDQFERTFWADALRTYGSSVRLPEGSAWITPPW